MIGSLGFWIFLTVAAIAYWNWPKQRKLFLAAASLSFLLTMDLRAVSAVLAWGLVFYFGAPKTNGATWQARAWFYCLLGGILSFLAWFKFVGPNVFTVEQEEPIIRMFYHHKEDGFLIPLGVSYFTFKLIHFLIESSRGNVQVRNLSTFFLYLVFFPIFPAGPIERYDDFLKNQDSKWSLDSMLVGVRRIQFGIIKKFFFGDIVLAYLIQQPSTEGILKNIHEVPTSIVWLHLCWYFLFAYTDFSGYSDIAIGAARIFGFRICENFNYPLRASNIGDFWKRWHMSLSNWCQSYVYMPTIGLTRNPYLAVFATMSAIGLWHAGTVTWLCWGLYHATGIVVFLTLNRLKRKYRWNLQKYEFYPIFAQALTLMFVIGSFSFMAAYKQGEVYPAFQLLAKLVGAV